MNDLSQSPPPSLRMTGISKSFGATRALTDVTLAVRGGETLALIGENGAGKSTLMKILSGVIWPDAGKMELAGRRYAPRGPHDARQAGVAMIYQELNLAPELSVEDNIMLGQERSCFGLLRRSRQRPLVREALARLGHSDIPLDAPVRRLSPATGQIVEIARALAMQSRVIVFDEPTSSLTGADAENLFRVIEALKRSGMAVIYISHFLEEVRRVADRYTVLRDGRVVGQGALAETTEAQIISLMVGRTVDELFPQVPRRPGAALLEIQSLSGRRLPRDVALEVRRGEVLGIAGLVGSGRTELLRTIMALDPVRSGVVRISGTLSPHSPRRRMGAGLALVSEDRKREGLAQTRSVEDNLTLSRLQPYSRWGWLNLRRREQAARQWMERLRIKARSPGQAVAELSGGNQQKVALARVLHQDADVLLLDEPTRGVDVGTKAELYRLIGELAAAGKGVLFVSSYLPELLATCDRVAVMRRGRVVAMREASAWSEETMMACAVGADEIA